MSQHVSSGAARQALDWAQAYGGDTRGLETLPAELDELCDAAIAVREGAPDASWRLVGLLQELTARGDGLHIAFSRVSEVVDRLRAARDGGPVLGSRSMEVLVAAVGQASIETRIGTAGLAALADVLGRLITLEAWGARRMPGGDDLGPGGAPVLGGFDGPLPGLITFRPLDEDIPDYMKNDLPFFRRAESLLEAIGRLGRPWVVELPCEVQAWKRIARESQGLPVYRIDSVTPAAPCPGQLATVHGSGFGAAGGRVTYTRRGGVHDGEVKLPDKWTDTAVTFVVPDDCTEGDIGLVVVDHVFVECDQTWEVPRHGAPDRARMGGGMPDAYGITVNGNLPSTAVTMGEPLTVAWQASSSTGVTVQVVVTSSGPLTPMTLLLDLTLGPGPGSATTIPVPPAASSQYIEVSVTATNACGGWRQNAVFYSQPRIDIAVTGIEVTQGTQVFPKEAAPNRNSLQLVAGKATCLRVYARATMTPSDFTFGAGPGQIPHVRGGVVWRSESGGYMWSGSAVSTASYDADDTPDRDWINAALVFRIPAYATAGNCYADIAIHVGPFAPATSTQRFTAKSAMCRFIPRRSLKILLARIGWAHGGFGADLSGVKGLLDTFPIPDGEVEFVLPVRTMLTNADLQDATKEDHDTWEDALDDLVDAAEDWEGERDLVLGSLSTDVELVLNGIADPTERVCFALDDRPATIAHEVAHLFGVHHANCGDDIEDVDSRLPSDGQFGENVFRPQSLVLYDQPMKDLMSYCWPNGNKHTFTMDTEMDYQDRQISPELWRLLLKVLP